jgi:hypothetical protein
MKRMLKAVCPVLIAMSVACAALIAVAGLTGCCGDNPKTLAKQVYELTQELRALSVYGESDEMDELEDMLDEIQVKVEALSDKNQEIFEAEFGRLMEEEGESE